MVVLLCWSCVVALAPASYLAQGGWGCEQGPLYQVSYLTFFSPLPLNLLFAFSFLGDNSALMHAQLMSWNNSKCCSISSTCRWSYVLNDFEPEIILQCMLWVSLLVLFALYIMLLYCAFYHFLSLPWTMRGRGFIGHNIKSPQFRNWYYHRRAPYNFQVLHKRSH